MVGEENAREMVCLELRTSEGKENERKMGGEFHYLQNLNSLSDLFNFFLFFFHFPFFF